MLKNNSQIFKTNFRQSLKLLEVFDKLKKNKKDITKKTIKS